jgi:hypothetical protein
MHLENFARLVVFLPLFAFALLVLGSLLVFEKVRQRRQLRAANERQRRYWVAEFAYRARLRAKEWVTRTKTPRLTYQGPPLAEQPKTKRRK